jgi:hypothetical protein
MRRLVVVVVVLAVIVAGLSVADVIVRRHVQTAIAHRIEARDPGASATVHIGSFPFVGRLLVEGMVPDLKANITGVSAGGLQLASVVVEAHGIHVGTSKLFQRQVVLQRISSGRVTAVITQGELDRFVGLPVTFGNGTVGIDGVQLPASVSVVDSRVRIALPAGQAVSFALPHLAVLPCVDSATIAGGSVRLTCALSSLPPALAGYTVHF